MGREDRMVITKTEEAVKKVNMQSVLMEEFAFVLYKGELHKYGIAENRKFPGYMRKSWGRYCLRGAKLRCMNLLGNPENIPGSRWKNKLRQGSIRHRLSRKPSAYVGHFGYIDDAAGAGALCVGSYGA